MSVKVYGKMWLATEDDINDVLLREKVTQQLEPETERVLAHGIFANLYARYVMIVNRLGEIYDQTLQVQKRACVRRILESCTLRMIELQTELKNIEMSEFMYLDQTLIEDKLRPEQVQLLCPFYYPMLRPKEMQDIVDGVRKPPPVVEVEEGAEKKTNLQLLIEEKARLDALANAKDTPWDNAIKLIKIHEKARQARCLFNYIQLHPEIYRPQPPVAKADKEYIFYHKPDQPMLIPVKRTIYESNYYQSLRTYSNIKFYESPLREANKLPDDVDEAVEEIDHEIEDIVVSPSQRESYQLMLLQMLELEKEKEIRKQLRNDAATKIQRCFLRWRIKRLVRKTKFRRFVRIGMADERRWDFSERELNEAQRKTSKLRKEAFDIAFQKACEDTKARIVKVRSPWIMEDISDHIRAWFRQMYDAGEEMDKFPPAAKGGTIMVLNGLTPSPWEFVEFLKQRELLANMSADQRKKVADEAKKKKAEEKKKIKDEKLKKAQAKADKAKLALKQGKTWEFQDDDFITKNYLTLNDQMIEQKRDWRFIDEFANVKSEPYMEWIEEDKYAELHVELRAVVDDLMRVEYELLRMAWSKDVKKKYRAPKAPKEKKAKKGKGKKVESLDFGQRDVESVYDSFLEAGVIATYPERRLEDYIGDRNYCAYEMRNYYDTDPWHFMGEVRDVLRQFLLGMGDIQMKHTKSLCIMGPPGCGKKYMVDAIATDMGVIKFDLSPTVVVKFKDNLNLFFDDVLKMAKLMQPSMLYIDGAHNPFIKKILPENQASQPKLIAKYLPKILKKLKPQDRVMLVSTTNQPWNCAVAKLKKTFEVVLLSNGSDYGSTFLTWRTALLDMEGTDRLFDLSAISKVTQFYGTKQILDTANTVVDIKRRVYLERRPLQQEELLNYLLAGPEPTNFPMPEADRMKYQKIFQKLNKLAKSRVAYRTEKLKPKKK